MSLNKPDAFFKLYANGSYFHISTHLVNISRKLSIVVLSLAILYVIYTLFKQTALYQKNKQMYNSLCTMIDRVLTGLALLIGGVIIVLPILVLV